MGISKPASILRGVFVGLILLGILDLANANRARGGSAKEAGAPEALLPQQTPSALTATQIFLPLATRMGFNPPVEILTSWIEDQDGDPKTIFLPYDQVNYKVTIANNANSAQSAMVRWTQTGPCGDIVLKEQTLMFEPGVWSKILVPDAQIPDCQGVHTNLIEVIYEKGTFPDAFLHIVTSPFQGFDKCALPTISQMQTWWNDSPYYTINLYIGGISLACKDPKLGATWLSAVAQQGWTYLLTWVGPQAPCTNFKYRMSWNPATAKTQGRSEADAAAAVAKNLGFPTDKMIYYDMEGYSNQATAACKTTVSSFMQGWVERLDELGFRGGAYGGACSSFVADWASNPMPPDSVWMAHWYKGSYSPEAHVWNTPCVGNSMWPDHQRLKQYAGDHTETWGGLAFTIDSNVLDGEVATFQSAPSTLSAVPDSLHAAPSSPAETQEISAMGLLSPDQGWVFRSGQLFHTQDGGEAWLDITPEDIGVGDFLGITFLDSPQSAQGWVVGRSIVEGGASLSVLRTSDAGQNWTAALLPVSPEEAISIETAYLDFIDPQTGWVAIKLHSGNNFSLGRLFATQDGGQTWEERPLPLGEPVRFADPSRGWIAGGPAGDQLYRTPDGGLTWEAQSLPIPDSLDFEVLFVGLPEFATSLSGFLPVTLSGGSSPRLVLFETADAGQTWILERVIGLGSTTQQPRGKIPFSGTPGAPGEWWAATPGEGLLVSADPAGKPVTLAASGLSGAIVDIDFTSGGTGWAIVQEGTCQGTKTPAGQSAPAGSEPWRCELRSQLMATEDGGYSWVEVTPPEQ